MFVVQASELVPGFPGILGIPAASAGPEHDDRLIVTPANHPNGPNDPNDEQPDPEPDDQ